jgi:hypothetical protein
MKRALLRITTLLLVVATTAAIAFAAGALVGNLPPTTGEGIALAYGGAAVLVALWVLRATRVLVTPTERRLRRRRLGLCPSCGYDLRATPDRCPECGAAATTPV